LGNQKISENHPFLITLGIGLSRSGSLPSNLKIGVMGFEMFIFFDTNRNGRKAPTIHVFKSIYLLQHLFSDTCSQILTVYKPQGLDICVNG
jgi:hypothetical protein